MHSDLDRLLKTLEPAAPENLGLRLRFGFACAQHVAHLLYGATSDPAAFEPEYEWQARQLQGLLDRAAGPRAVAG